MTRPDKHAAQPDPAHWMTIAEWNATVRDLGGVTLADGQYGREVWVSREPDPTTGMHWIMVVGAPMPTVSVISRNWP